MTEITYKIIGDSNFLRDTEYIAQILNFFDEFKDKFQLVESISIQFEEIINSNHLKLREPDFSEDGKNINVIYRISRHNQGKGSLSKPNVTSFYRDLRHYIENILIPEDIKRFKALE